MREGRREGGRKGGKKGGREERRDKVLNVKNVPDINAGRKGGRA